MQDKLQNSGPSIWLPIAWITLILLRSSSTLGDGFHFLFRLGKPQIGDQEPFYSKGQVWSMHDGTVAILGLLFWGSTLLYGLGKRAKMFVGAGRHNGGEQEEAPNRQ
jgi:hypothetical protein